MMELSTSRVAKRHLEQECGEWGVSQHIVQRVAARHLHSGKTPHGWLFHTFDKEMRKAIGAVVKQAMSAEGFKYQKHERSQGTDWAWRFVDPNGNPRDEVNLFVGVATPNKGFIYSCFDERIDSVSDRGWWSGQSRANWRVQVPLQPGDKTDTPSLMKELTKHLREFIKMGAADAKKRITHNPDPMHAASLVKKAMISPLEIKRLAVRIETLQRANTRGWRGDELEFRNSLPGGRARNALPDPADLRELADRADPADLKTAARQWRTWIATAMRLEGLVQDNDPRKPKNMMRDMARGKLPRMAGRFDWRQIAEDLDQVSIRLRKDLLWTFDDLKERNFREVHEDSAAETMRWLHEAKARADEPSDLAALEAAEDALLQYGKKRKWALRKWASGPVASRVASRYEAEAIERRAAREIEAGIKDWLKWMAQPFKVIYKHHKEFVSGPIDDAVDNIIRELAPLFVKKLGEIEVDADVDEFLEGAQAGKWHADQNELKDEGRYRSETEDFLEGFHWGFDNNADWDGRKLPSGIKATVVKDAIKDFRSRVTEQVIAKVLKNAWSIVSPAHTLKAIMAAVKKHGWKLGVGFALFEIFEHSVLPALAVWATGNPSWAVLGTLPIGEVIYAIIIRILGRAPSELNEGDPDGHLDWYEAQYGEVRLASEPDFPPYGEWSSLYRGQAA